MLRVQKWHGIGSVGLRMKETSGWEGWRNGTKLSSWNIHWISLSKLVLYGWYELRTTCWGAKASRQQEPLQDWRNQDFSLQIKSRNKINPCWPMQNRGEYASIHHMGNEVPCNSLREVKKEKLILNRSLCCFGDRKTSCRERV